MQYQFNQRAAAPAFMIAAFPVRGQGQDEGDKEDGNAALDRPRKNTSDEAREAVNNGGGNGVLGNRPDNGSAEGPRNRPERGGGSNGRDRTPGDGPEGGGGMGGR